MIGILHIGLLLCGVYAASPFCLDGEKELVDGTRCLKYVECENGRWHLMQCQFGEQFNPRSQICESVSRFECEDGKARCEEGKKFSHPGSHSLYYQCQNGRISTKYCGAGEVFDHETGQCQVIDSLINSHQATARVRRSADAVCEENLKRRDGKSCKNYIECINGQQVNKTCPDCMNFDEVNQSCRLNVALPCGPKSNMPTLPPKPTTTPQPEPSPETKPTPAPEPKPTSAPEPKPTSAPEPKPTSAPEPQPTSAPEPKPTSAPEPKPTSEPEPKPTSAPEPQPTSAPEPKPTSAPK